jgi:hypothetical protein
LQALPFLCECWCLVLNNAHAASPAK